MFHFFERVYNVAKHGIADGLNASWAIPGFLPSDFDRRGLRVFRRISFYQSSYRNMQIIFDVVTYGRAA